jgi:hypothetical protein
MKRTLQAGIRYSDLLFGRINTNDMCRLICKNTVVRTRGKLFNIRFTDIHTNDNYYSGIVRNRVILRKEKK